MKYQYFNDKFIDLILESMMKSDLYNEEEDKLMNIQTFTLIVDKFNLDTFTENYYIDEFDYNIYFKYVLKKYDKKRHKEIIKKLGDKK